MFVLRHIVALA